LLVKDGATTGKIAIIQKSEHENQNINEHVFLMRLKGPTPPVGRLPLSIICNRSFNKTYLPVFINDSSKLKYLL
jgi:hypothetical protein